MKAFKYIIALLFIFIGVILLISGIVTGWMTALVGLVLIVCAIALLTSLGNKSQQHYDGTTKKELSEAYKRDLLTLQSQRDEISDIEQYKKDLRINVMRELRQQHADLAGQIDKATERLVILNEAIDKGNKEYQQILKKIKTAQEQYNVFESAVHVSHLIFDEQTKSDIDNISK